MENDQINENIYFDEVDLLTRAYKKGKILALFGDRGKGKSYFCKRRACIDWCIQNNVKFLWVRTSKEKVKELKKGSKAWYNDIQKRYNDVTQNGENIYYKGKQIGLILPLSLHENYKGSAWDDYGVIILDEALQAVKEKYDVAFAFLDLLETVFRLRKGLVVLTSNTLSADNWFFNTFNIHPSMQQENGLFENTKAILHIEQSEEFRQVKSKSMIGKLLEGTSYGDYSMKSKFILDDMSGVIGDVKEYRFKFVIKTKETMYGVWVKKIGKFDNYHISRHYNKNSKSIFIFDKEDIGHDVIKGNDTQMLSFIYLMFTLRKLTFDKMKTKNDIIEIVRKNYTKY